MKHPITSNEDSKNEVFIHEFCCKLLPVFAQAGDFIFNRQHVHQNVNKTSNEFTVQSKGKEFHSCADQVRFHVVVYIVNLRASLQNFFSILFCIKCFQVHN